MQINAWSEFSTMNNTNHEPQPDENSCQHDELADWFIDNKIVEYLFGPNLHVEVSFY
jgi:hypothetical protein